MRNGVLLAALSAAVLLSGCSDDPQPEPPAPAEAEAEPPSFDPEIDPATAVLALVPDDVITITVTDFDQVRLELGLPDLDKDDEPADVAAFWKQADAERPLLSPGMLRATETELQNKYGFSQLDVAWEAQLLSAAGTKKGYVLAFRDGTDMTAVANAVAEGAAPLAGAEVDEDLRLVTRGTTGDPTASWAASPETVALTAGPSNSTYLTRSCAPVDTTDSLDELTTYSVAFEGSLATARLGPKRDDLFTRMRVGLATPGFDEGYAGGVADPTSGRIGYQMTDPPTAAAMALANELPFAACGGNGG